MKKKIISVVSGKGGVGKSTIVSLIGLALKRKNNKVLLIDADIGLSNLELILHTEKSPYDLEDVLNGEIEIDSVYNYLDKNLAIVNLYNHISINEFDEEKVLNIFPRLIENFNVVIIDAPSGIEKGFEFAVKSYTEAIIVINQTNASVSDAIKVEYILKNIYQKPYYFILNKYSSKNSKIFFKKIGYISNKIKFFIKNDEKISQDKFISEALLEKLYLVVENEKEYNI